MFNNNFLVFEEAFNFLKVLTNEPYESPWVESINRCLFILGKTSAFEPTIVIRLGMRTKQRYFKIIP